MKLNCCRAGITSILLLLYHEYLSVRVVLYVGDNTCQVSGPGGCRGRSEAKCRTPQHPSPRTRGRSLGAPTPPRGSPSVRGAAGPSRGRRGHPHPAPAAAQTQCDRGMRRLCYVIPHCDNIHLITLRGSGLYAAIRRL